MSSFLTTPGNTRHDALRSLMASPRQRVQRIMQVTRTYWWPAVEPARQAPKPARPEFGPGRRPLKLSCQG